MLDRCNRERVWEWDRYRGRVCVCVCVCARERERERERERGLDIWHVPQTLKWTTESNERPNHINIYIEEKKQAPSSYIFFSLSIVMLSNVICW